MFFDGANTNDSISADKASVDFLGINTTGVGFFVCSFSFGFVLSSSPVFASRLLLFLFPPHLSRDLIFSSTPMPSIFLLSTIVGFATLPTSTQHRLYSVRSWAP